MPYPTTRFHMIYPDGNERTFVAASVGFDKFLGECLGGQFDIIDTGSHDFIAVNESIKGIPNRVAMARYGINAYGPVAILAKADAQQFISED